MSVNRNKILPSIIILAVIAALLLIFRNKYEDILKYSHPEQKKDTIQHIPVFEYGINVDSMKVIKGIVKPDENLSIMLFRYNITPQTIDSLIKKSKDIFDIRKIRSGNKYTVLLSKGAAKNLLYFIYEENITSYTVFALKDSIYVYKGEKKVKKEIKKTSGIIKTSLWNTIMENDGNINLAVALEDIYQWNIDFYSVQKGDSYKAIYEELFVDGKSVGIGKVFASSFRYSNKEFYAFYFVQDSVGDYFDETANSLKRAFLKAPLKFSRISSRFSKSRLHPILRIRRPHYGVDYTAPKGTPVSTIGDGIIVEACWKKGAGNFIKVKHNSTYTTTYMHLSGYGKGIKKGVHVKQGDIIGYVGSTGLSTGPHLDFRFYKNGKPVDPLKIISPPAKPVNPENIDEYNKLKEKMLPELNKIKVPDIS